MYGNFKDITAHEFIHVQLDLSEFRLSWDENTAQCCLLEEDLDEQNQTLSQVSLLINFVSNMYQD